MTTGAAAENYADAQKQCLVYTVAYFKSNTAIPHLVRPPLVRIAT